MSAFCEFCKFCLKSSGAVLQFASILLILSFFCSVSALTLSLSPDDEAARDVALQWLQLVDSGKYKDAALQTVEQVRVLPHWLSYFAARRTPLGAVKNRQIVEVKHAQSIRGVAEYAKYDIIRLKTSFQKHKARPARPPLRLNTNDGSAFCPRREVVPRKIIRPSLALSGQGAACERQNEIAGKIRPVAPSSCVARNKARYSVLQLVPS